MHTEKQAPANPKYGHVTAAIDCEFNGYKGQLISMAIVPIAGAPSFYETLLCVTPTDWVAINVMPVLNKSPITLQEFQRKLEDYMLQFRGMKLVADWPDDIKYFCDALITGPGARINTCPLTMSIERDIEAPSDCPHNALADAEGIREFMIQREHERRKVSHPFTHEHLPQ